MPLLYRDMTPEQKAEFDLIILQSEKIRAAQAGIGLDKLAEDPAIIVRRNVALSRDVTPEILEKLALDPEDAVVRNVAGNPNCNPYTMSQLATRDRQTANQLAINPSITPRAAEIIAMGEFSTAKRVLAGNKSVYPRVLTVLAETNETTWPHLADNTSTPPATLAHIAEHGGKSAREYVAMNPSTEPDTLELLASDNSWEVRRAVAGNRGITRDVAAILFKDTSDTVRMHLAGNPTLTTSMLRELTAVELAGEYTSDDVVKSLAANPKTPADALALIVANIGEEPQNIAELEALKNAYGNPSMYPSDAAAGLMHPNEDVKIAAIGNSATPLYALQELIENPNISSKMYTRAVDAIEAKEPGWYAENRPVLPLDRLIDDVRVAEEQMRLEEARQAYNRAAQAPVQSPQIAEAHELSATAYVAQTAGYEEKEPHRSHAANVPEKPTAPEKADFGKDLTNAVVAAAAVGAAAKTIPTPGKVADAARHIAGK